MGDRELGLYGVVGGKTMIALAVFTMRLVRDKIAVVEMRGEMDG